MEKVLIKYFYVTRNQGKRRGMWTCWTFTVSGHVLGPLHQFSSVAQSCLTLCDPMDCSTPGFPVFHYLLDFAQTHVYWVGDAILPAHPLPPSPPFAFILFQHQGLFQWVSSLHQVAKNNFSQTGLLFPTSTFKSFFIPYPSLLSPLSPPTPSNFSYLSPQRSTKHAVTSLTNNF